MASLRHLFSCFAKTAFEDIARRANISRTLLHRIFKEGDEASAEVFLLALDGLLADRPSPEMLERRVKLLAARFAPRP